MEYNNPYQPSVVVVDEQSESGQGSFLSPADAKKAEVVIREADQFWVALIFVGIGNLVALLIIGPWYTIRYLQWRSLAAKYPMLMQPSPEAGSLSERFQASSWKLLTCIIIGLAIFGFMLMLVSLLFLTSVRQ